MKKKIVITIVIYLFLLSQFVSIGFADLNLNQPKRPGMLIQDSPYTEIIEAGDTSVAVFDYDPPTITGDVGPWIDQIDETVVENYIQGLVSFGPRVTGSTACDDAGTYIYNEFEDMGLDVAYHYWSSGSLSGKNVEATLPGMNTSSDKIFIVLGHYDSVSGSPGADDNAAGTTAALAAAEILSQYSFNHTIRFLAVDGEEQGLHGSDAYAEDAANNGDNIIAALNADMIGYAPNPGDGDKVKLYSNSASYWLYEYIVDIETVYEPVIGNFDVIDAGYSGGSDHASFWSEGYDSVFYHEYNFNDYYHSPDDVIGYMNMTYDAKVTQLIVATLAELAEPRGLGPILSYEPSFLNAGSCSVNETKTLIFEIFNDGNETLTYQFVETCDWLTITPLSGNSTGEHDIITVEVNTTGLSPGEYECPITIQSNDLPAEYMVYLSVIENASNVDIDQIIFDRGFPIRSAIDGDWAGAQSFQPNSSLISSVDVFLRKFGDPEFDLIVELRKDAPEGAFIDSGTFTPAEISTSWGWVSVDFTDTIVDSETEYFIVCPPAPSGVTTSFGYEWGYTFDDQYSEGSFWFTRDSGLLWRALPTKYEFTFRTFGIE